MTDFNAELPTNAGVLLTTRTGTTSGDTVPAGCVLILRNAGAASHTVSLTVGATFDGLSVSNRAVSIGAGGVGAIRVPANYGDANGRVPIAINGTANEVTYQILGM
ncbi:hypothetical protein [Micromonospora costi]|uniref:Uncharacterized protein n=1 Tax=Micromonospora costi TaxID=1530042 RepID=A0A3B0AA61_9ACTN|nr:hypothetical protein [Micromonospora costi]RKN55947.1 hypothetical protein D7193_15285 [Micromonospora costi]